METAGKITLHEKAFAHLTRGMYRSPASAVRELVSNAWDAGAKNVRIRTGVPLFAEMTVADDGCGFDREEFLRIVEGGLGNSEKRQRADSPTTRPLIGRLGVGMFGIAQICGSFTVASNPETGEPFKARVRLYSLLKDELDKPKTDLVHYDEDDGPLEIDIGEYELLEFDPDEFERHGTRIVADVMHPVFTSTFKDAARRKDGTPRRTWSKVIDQATRHHSLQEVGEYFRFIWEIAASVPVPYVDKSAVPNGAIAAFQSELLSYDFNVFIDGIQIYKPVYLKGNSKGYTVVTIPPASAKVFNRKVSFRGYIAVQEGKQLQPDELRGILIRVKGVGIGTYDESLLDYRYNEGPRSRWITGEIYIIDGLENALNVDRDSFNRFHPDYRYLQESIHNILREKVFPEVYVKLKKRSTDTALRRSAARTEALADTLKETFGVRSKALPWDGKTVAIPQADGSRKEIEIASAAELNTKKVNRQLASSILAIFDAPMLESDRKKARQVFSEALLKLLRDW